MHKFINIRSSNPLSIFGVTSRAFAKEPQGVLEAKLRSNKEKPFNPLVICGPPASGKVDLFCN